MRASKGLVDRAYAVAEYQTGLLAVWFLPARSAQFVNRTFAIFVENHARSSHQREGKEVGEERDEEGGGERRVSQNEWRANPTHMVCARVYI